MSDTTDRIPAPDGAAATWPPVMARVAAIAVDGVVLIPTQIIGLIIAGNLILAVDDPQTSLDALGVVGAVVAVVAAFLPTIYFTVAHASPWQATLGKRLFRMAVVVQPDGRHVGLGRSFARAVVFAATIYTGGAAAAIVFQLLGDTTLLLFLLTILFVAGLFLVPAIARPDGRCLHDLMAGTLVIDDPRR